MPARHENDNEKHGKGGEVVIGTPVVYRCGVYNRRRHEIRGFRQTPLMPRLSSERCVRGVIELVGSWE